MSVSLTGVGGFFTRSGAIVGEYNRVASLYGSALTAGFQSIWSQFASSEQAAVADLPNAVASYRNSAISYQNTLVGDGQQQILLQTQADTTVTPATVARAVAIIASQMVTAGASIQRATLGSTITAGGTNLGDTTVAVSTTNQYGDPLDMLFAETLTLTCTSSPTTSYAATLGIAGATAVLPSAYNWPAGSGASTSLTVADPGTSGIVNDGDFERWGGTGNNTPTNWDIIDGAAGVTVTRGTGGVRDTSSFTAQIVSDGASLTQLGQAISVSPNTVYMVSVQVKISSLTAAGAFIMSLTDADGNILTNDAGTPLSYTRNVNGQITTGFTTITAFFSTPRQLPTVVNVQFGISTAVTAARTITLDLASVVAATQAYAGGPFIAAVGGADPSAVGDYWTAAMTNSLTSQSFARGSDRLFSLRQLNVYYPSANSPTVSDNLVLH